MIYDALKLIQSGLQQYIDEVEQPDQPGETVTLGNIAMSDALGGSRSDMNDRVVMSVINLEEETTLKNSPHYRLENGRTVYRNPPISLNVFVLFSVLHPEQYSTALKRLSSIIEFFQWKKEFSFRTPPTELREAKDIRVLADLYTLTFDQLNHLWGTLGGKQVPFVMYKLRLVSLDAGKRQGEAAPIEERVFEA